MDESQPDHLTPIQRFLAWEASPDTLRTGTIGPKNEDTEQYIPHTTLDSYFESYRRVREILEIMFPNNPPDANVIWEKYRRGFAILLSIHQGPMIRQFFDYSNLQDKFLPFHKRPANFPESSKENFFNHFRDRQWRYFPLELTYKMRGPIDPDVILPFQVKERLGRGRSANVHKIEIDEAYNDLGHRTHGGVRRRFYVVKTFHGRDAEKYFTTERDAFEKLNACERPPDHLIGFHGSFTRHGKYHLILEYADRGTLKGFMVQHNPPSTGEDVLLFWTRLCGILLGLHNLHEVGGQVPSSVFMSGWHQDVKPTNILVKSCPNPKSIYDCEFMLADLGLCHFRSSERDVMDITDRDTHGTYAYGAPEAHRIGPSLKDVPISVTPKVDVWSAGCIFSEVATWVVRGSSGVEQYRVERQKEVSRKLNNPEDGDLFHDGVKALDAVEESHRLVQDSRRVDDFITLKVVNDVISDMLRDRWVRAYALQAHNKAEIAVRAATKELQAFRERRSPVLEPTNLAVWLNSESQGQNVFERKASSPTSEGDEPKEDKDPPPRISIATILHWRAEKRFGRDAQLPDQELLKWVRDRDSFFLVDNSSSMKIHKHEARKVLEAMAYVVKKYDPNGVDMVFTQSGHSVFSTKRTTLLLNAFDAAVFGGRTDMEMNLGTILETYKKKLTPPRWSPWPWTRPRPLSLYILTDGVWQPGCNVQSVIESMVDYLSSHNLFKHVAIQFIRFGHSNKEAIRSLDYLDDGLGLKLDIVDTTPANGNAWKMILGAIHTWFDKDNQPMTA